MWLIGDVHRKVKEYLAIVKKIGADASSIQLGDFGYAEDWNSLSIEYMMVGHWLIHGNHDDPLGYLKHPAYTGPFGPHGDRVFFFSGAETRYPLNERKKKIGINWWPANEELSYSQMQRAAVNYLNSYSEIVVSHDCPAEIKQELIGKKPKDRTSDFLQTIFEIRQPQAWYFGHHHKSWEKTINGTKFRCLDELEVLEI